MEHVTVSHAGRNVLEDFHLNIYEGEFLFVYGYPDSGIAELGQILKGTMEIQEGRFYAGESEITKSAFENPGSIGMYFVQNANNLVEEFTVAENLFFGGNKKYFTKVVPKKQQELMAGRVIEKMGLDVMFDPSKKVVSLPYEERILLKLVMAYVHGAKLVVLDRIMGFDLDRGGRFLEKTLRILQDDGTAILWLNQRMDAAWYMADRVLIMQDGNNVRTIYKGYEGAPDNLLQIARENGNIVSQLIAEDRNAENSSDVIFELDGLTSQLFSDMSLKIYKGEIVSICSMNTLLLQHWRNIVTGTEGDYQGSMKLDGKAFRPKSYSDCVRQGVCYLDIMWYEDHCNPEMSIEDNLLMPSYWHLKELRVFMDNGMRDHARYFYRKNYPDWPRDYWWKLTADQQKVLLMEKLCLDPHRLVIITEPFFQLHNTMLENVYRMIRKIQDNNGAVVLMAGIDKDVGPVSDRVYYLDKWA